MNRLERRVVNAERRTFGRGTCPHRPPLVVYVEDWDGPTKKPPRERPCLCGRPRLRVVIRYVTNWHERYDEEPEAEA